MLPVHQVSRRPHRSDCEIHALLAAPEDLVAALVGRGQDSDCFGRHLPPDVLGRLAHTTVFTLADDARTHVQLDVHAATLTTLLLLGVRKPRARSLSRPRS